MAASGRPLAKGAGGDAPHGPGRRASSCDHEPQFSQVSPPRLPSMLRSACRNAQAKPLGALLQTGHSQNRNAVGRSCVPYDALRSAMGRPIGRTPGMDIGACAPVRRRGAWACALTSRVVLVGDHARSHLPRWPDSPRGGEVATALRACWPSNGVRVVAWKRSDCASALLAGGSFGVGRRLESRAGFNADGNRSHPRFSGSQVTVEATVPL